MPQSEQLSACSPGPRGELCFPGTLFLPQQPRILAPSPLYSSSLATHPHIPPPRSEARGSIRIFARLPRGGGCFGWEISMGSEEKSKPRGSRAPAKLAKYLQAPRQTWACCWSRARSSRRWAGRVPPSQALQEEMLRQKAKAGACRNRDRGLHQCQLPPSFAGPPGALHPQLMCIRECCKLPCPQPGSPSTHTPPVPPQEPCWRPSIPVRWAQSAETPAWHLSPAKLKTNSCCHSGSLVGNLFTLDAAALSFMEMFILNI